MNKVILHIDMNNYFASVECIERPELKNVPMAVCGDPKMRHGIVLAKNDEAKKYGILTGESSYSAKMKCPNITILKPDYPKYLQYAKLARNIYADYSKEIFPYGMDEAWIDVTYICGCIEEGKDVADRIRGRIKKELSLTASVGVSFNYIFSKLASDMKKPDATSVIKYDEYKYTTWNMPAFDMLFVGPSTRKTLKNMGILTIGDLARSNPSLLSDKIGKKGWMLWRFANGDDSSFNPCTIEEDDIKSLGNTLTPPKDITAEEDALAFLYILSCVVSKRLLKHNFKALCISIIIRRSDFSIISRQKTLSRAMDKPDEIFGIAYELFIANHKWSNNIRSIGVKADKLTSYVNEQMSLLDLNDVIIDTDVKVIIENIEKKYGAISLEKSVSGRDFDITIND